MHMQLMVWAWSACVYMLVSEVYHESLKSDLVGVTICGRLAIFKLPQITGCYYQCSANRRQFAFG